MRYRRPYAEDFEDLDLDTAMDMIAERVLDTRRRTWQDTVPGPSGPVKRPVPPVGRTWLEPAV